MNFDEEKKNKALIKAEEMADEFDAEEAEVSPFLDSLLFWFNIIVVQFWKGYTEVRRMSVLLT